MRTVVPTLAKKPDTSTLSTRLARNDMDREEALDALASCVEYIEDVELVLEDLRDKCAEAVRLLG